MAQAATLSPPIDAGVEIVWVDFDYAAELNPGVTLTSIVSVTCKIHQGTDPNPSSRLIGDPSIVPSPSTDVAATAVSQLVGNCVGGVVYLLQCVATTSDGQTLSVWVYLPCRTPS